MLCDTRLQKLYKCTVLGGANMYVSVRSRVGTI
jgi:hypothetical protein